MLFLAFALFQTREDFRKILFFFDPGLEKEGPDTKVRHLSSSLSSLLSSSLSSPPPLSSSTSSLSSYHDNDDCFEIIDCLEF